MKRSNDLGSGQDFVSIDQNGVITKSENFSFDREKFEKLNILVEVADSGGKTV